MIRTEARPNRIVRYWHILHALVYQIQTSTPENIFGAGFVAMALVIAAFPGARAISAAHNGNTGGLVIAGLLMVMFAASGGGLLFRSRLSDREMQILLSPMFLLWCLMAISVFAALTTRPETTGGVLIIFIIVSMLMVMGMTYTFSPHRNRPTRE